MKKTIAFITSLCLSASILFSASNIDYGITASARAGTLSSSNLLKPPKVGATSGTCGEELTWTLDSGGKLTISGNGPMKDGHNIKQ